VKCLLVPRASASVVCFVFFGRRHSRPGVYPIPHTRYMVVARLRALARFHLAVEPLKGVKQGFEPFPLTYPGWVPDVAWRARFQKVSHFERFFGKGRRRQKEKEEEERRRRKKKEEKEGRTEDWIKTFNLQSSTFNQEGGRRSRRTTNKKKQAGSRSTKKKKNKKKKKKEKKKKKKKKKKK